MWDDMCSGEARSREIIWQDWWGCACPMQYGIFAPSELSMNQFRRALVLLGVNRHTCFLCRRVRVNNAVLSTS